MSIASEAQQNSVEETAFPFETYEEQAAELGAQYQATSPIPHLYFTGLFAPDVAHRLAVEFPDHDDETWIQYKHINENKAGKDKREEFPPLVGQVIDELNSPRFVALVSRITGIEGLVADPDIEGGGMHQATRGGFLNVHTDFTMHRKRAGWRRRCNLIVYLNEGWDAENWGGSIEYWSEGMKERVAWYPPLLNAAVLFSTPNALHGYPDPLRCPSNVARKSLQLYYYTVDAAPDEKPHATTYVPRPHDGVLKRFLIHLDNKMLEVYSWIKRRFGLTDESISWILGKLGGKKD